MKGHRLHGGPSRLAISEGHGRLFGASSQLLPGSLSALLMLLTFSVELLHGGCCHFAAHAMTTVFDRT